MIILAKLLGIAITAFGLVIFASPDFIKKVFDFFKEGKRIYLAGVLRVFIGLLLLLTVSHSTVPLAVISLGLLFLVSGIVVFAVDLEKTKVFLSHYSDLPQLIIRLLGLVAACFGLLIFSVL